MFKRRKIEDTPKPRTTSRAEVLERPLPTMTLFEYEAEYWARAEGEDAYNSILFGLYALPDPLTMTRLLGGMILQTKELRAEIEELKSAMIKVPPKN